MKSRILCMFVLLSFTYCLLAQNVKRVRGEYTYHAPENVTLEDAKRTALERAKIQTIADEFGTIVTQSTSTVVKNENGKSTTDFLSLGGSDVKGEWIETIGEPVYDIGYEQGMLVVKVTVEGKIREIVSAGVDFDAKILRNGRDVKFEDSDFRNGDDLYLYFKSPVDGYLAVYLLDETTMEVFCLLPYRNSGDGIYPIKHDKPYILFSEKHSENRGIVDEYTLTATRSVEKNSVYIIFSPNEFVKARAEDNTSATLPRQLSYNDYKEWLAKVRLRDKEMKVETKILTIRQ